jgi:hypothetical protein
MYDWRDGIMRTEEQCAACMIDSWFYRDRGVRISILPTETTTY